MSLITFSFLAALGLLVRFGESRLRDDRGDSWRLLLAFPLAGDFLPPDVGESRAATGDFLFDVAAIGDFAGDLLPLSALGLFVVWLAEAARGLVALFAALISAGVIFT